MKIVNIGRNSLIVKDIRGNKITINPNEQADVAKNVALSLKNRYKILIIEEKSPVHTFVEEKKAEESKKEVVEEKKNKKK